jgi:ribonucleoside-diphosphate reductase alpha chain
MSTKLTEQSLLVATDRYFNDSEKTSKDPFYKMCERLSDEVVKVENDDVREKVRKEFFDEIYSLRFVPGGRFWANSGVTNRFPNCYVISPEDSKESIFQTLTLWAFVHSSGGGIGGNFSKLRSKGMPTTTSKGTSSGPCSFIKLYNEEADTIRQGGSRRAACIAILNVNHPDILEFIMLKSKNIKDLERFNISVGIIDSFMNSLTNSPSTPYLFYDYYTNESYRMVIPYEKGVSSISQIDQIKYIEQHYNERVLVKEGLPSPVSGFYITPGLLWEFICYRNWYCGDPGLFFIDTVNKKNGLIKDYKDETNPYYIVSPNACVTGDTKVNIKSKGKIDIKDVEIGDEILTEERGEICYKRVINFINKGTQEVWEYKFLNGESIYATEDHKVPIFNFLGEMKRKDEIQFVGKDDYLKTVDNDFTKVESSKFFDAKEVFDITVEDTHTFFANDILISNCGEIPQENYNICMLGSLNLPQFVKEENGKLIIDYPLLSNSIRVAVRYLDNALDVSYYPDPKIMERVLETRRIGLGIMGWADLLIKFKIRYGSSDSFSLAKNISFFISQETLNASVALGKEKGSFPLFEQSAYSSKNDRDDFVKVPCLRNSYRNTIAPTGTTSILAMSSSGIEPIFEFEYTREDNIGTREIKHPLYEEWMNTNSGESEEKIPPYFITASEVNWREHVEMQAVFQSQVDNAISKTINLPESATIEDVKGAYELAYSLGCKGITVYRDKSKEFQVLNKKEEELPVNKTVTEWKKQERTEGILPGLTFKVKTGDGSLYVTINENDYGHPVEVFANVGKAGQDVNAYTEALGRVISSALQHNTPIEVLKTQLIGIAGSKIIFHNIGEYHKILSVPDAIGKVLEMYDQLGKKEKEFPLIPDPADENALLDNLNKKEVCEKCQTEYHYESGCKSCKCGSFCEE